MKMKNKIKVTLILLTTFLLVACGNRLNPKDWEYLGTFEDGTMAYSKTTYLRGKEKQNILENYYGYWIDVIDGQIYLELNSNGIHVEGYGVYDFYENREIEVQELQTAITDSEGNVIDNPGADMDYIITIPEPRIFIDHLSNDINQIDINFNLGSLIIKHNSSNDVYKSIVPISHEEIPYYYYYF